MAVARLKMERRWFLRTADLVPESSPRLARELTRAADRPGLTAELTPDELTVLEAVCPDLAPLVEARQALTLAQAEDARRAEDRRRNHPQRRR